MKLDRFTMTLMAIFLLATAVSSRPFEVSHSGVLDVQGTTVRTANDGSLTPGLDEGTTGWGRSSAARYDEEDDGSQTLDQSFEEDAEPDADQNDEVIDEPDDSANDATSNNEDAETIKGGNTFDAGAAKKGISKSEGVGDNEADKIDGGSENEALDASTSADPSLHTMFVVDGTIDTEAMQSANDAMAYSHPANPVSNSLKSPSAPGSDNDDDDDYDGLAEAGKQKMFVVKDVDSDTDTGRIIMNQGDELTLSFVVGLKGSSCKDGTTPCVDFLWTKDKTAVRDDGNRNGTLIKKHLQPIDEGFYRCVASRGMDMVLSKEVYVDVKSSDENKDQSGATSSAEALAVVDDQLEHDDPLRLTKCLGAMWNDRSFMERYDLAQYAVPPVCDYARTFCVETQTSLCKRAGDPPSECSDAEVKCSWLLRDCFLQTQVRTQVGTFHHCIMAKSLGLFGIPLNNDASVWSLSYAYASSDEPEGSDGSELLFGDKMEVKDWKREKLEYNLELHLGQRLIRLFPEPAEGATIVIDYEVCEGKCPALGSGNIGRFLKRLGYSDVVGHTEVLNVRELTKQAFVGVGVDGKDDKFVVSVWIHVESEDKRETKTYRLNFKAVPPSRQNKLDTLEFHPPLLVGSGSSVFKFSKEVDLFDGLTAKSCDDKITLVDNKDNKKGKPTMLLGVNGKSLWDFATDQIQLEHGSNVLTVQMKAEDGSIDDIWYTFRINCPYPDYGGILSRHISQLQDLAILTGPHKYELTPEFDPEWTSYEVDAGISDTISVVATLLDRDAHIELNGMHIENDERSPPYLLLMGTNKLEIKVTAIDRTTSSTYTILVKKHQDIPRPSVEEACSVVPKLTHVVLVSKGGAVDVVDLEEQGTGSATPITLKTFESEINRVYVIPILSADAASGSDSGQISWLPVVVEVNDNAAPTKYSDGGIDGWWKNDVGARGDRVRYPNHLPVPLQMMPGKNEIRIVVKSPCDIDGKDKRLVALVERRFDTASEEAATNEKVEPLTLSSLEVATDDRWASGSHVSSIDPRTSAVSYGEGSMATDSDIVHMVVRVRSTTRKLMIRARPTGRTSSVTIGRNDVSLDPLGYSEPLTYVKGMPNIILKAWSSLRTRHKTYELGFVEASQSAFLDMVRVIPYNEALHNRIPQTLRLAAVEKRRCRCEDACFDPENEKERDSHYCFQSVDLEDPSTASDVQIVYLPPKTNKFFVVATASSGSRTEISIDVELMGSRVGAKEKAISLEMSAGSGRPVTIYTRSEDGTKLMAYRLIIYPPEKAHRGIPVIARGQELAIVDLRLDNDFVYVMFNGMMDAQEFRFGDKTDLADVPVLTVTNLDAASASNNVDETGDADGGNSVGAGAEELKKGLAMRTDAIPWADFFALPAPGGGGSAGGTTGASVAICGSYGSNSGQMQSMIDDARRKTLEIVPRCILRTCTRRESPDGDCADYDNHVCLGGGVGPMTDGFTGCSWDCALRRDPRFLKFRSPLFSKMLDATDIRLRIPQQALEGIAGVKRAIIAKRTPPAILKRIVPRLYTKKVGAEHVGFFALFLMFDRTLPCPGFLNVAFNPTPKGKDADEDKSGGADSQFDTGAAGDWIIATNHIQNFVMTSECDVIKCGDEKEKKTSFSKQYDSVFSDGDASQFYWTTASCSGNYGVDQRGRSQARLWMMTLEDVKSSFGPRRPFHASEIVSEADAKTLILVSPMRKWSSEYVDGIRGESSMENVEGGPYGARFRINWQKDTNLVGVRDTTGQPVQLSIAETEDIRVVSIDEIIMPEDTPFPALTTRHIPEVCRLSGLDEKDLGGDGDGKLDSDTVDALRTFVHRCIPTATYRYLRGACDNTGMGGSDSGSEPTATESSASIRVGAQSFGKSGAPSKKVFLLQKVEGCFPRDTEIDAIALTARSFSFVKSSVSDADREDETAQETASEQEEPIVQAEATLISFQMKKGREYGQYKIEASTETVAVRRFGSGVIRMPFRFPTTNRIYTIGDESCEGPSESDVRAELFVIVSVSIPTDEHGAHIAGGVELPRPCSDELDTDPYTGEVVPPTLQIAFTNTFLGIERELAEKTSDEQKNRQLRSFGNALGLVINPFVSAKKGLTNRLPGLITFAPGSIFLLETTASSSTSEATSAIIGMPTIDETDMTFRDTEKGGRIVNFYEMYTRCGSRFRTRIGTEKKVDGTVLTCFPVDLTPCYLRPMGRLFDDGDTEVHNPPFTSEASSSQESYSPLGFPGPQVYRSDGDRDETDWKGNNIETTSWLIPPSIVDASDSLDAAKSPLVVSARGKEKCKTKADAYAERVLGIPVRPGDETTDLNQRNTKDFTPIKDGYVGHGASRVPVIFVEPQCVGKMHGAPCILSSGQEEGFCHGQCIPRAGPDDDGRGYRVSTLWMFTPGVQVRVWCDISLVPEIEAMLQKYPRAKAISQKRSPWAVGSKTGNFDGDRLSICQAAWYIGPRGTCKDDTTSCSVVATIGGADQFPSGLARVTFSVAWSVDRYGPEQP